MTNLLESSSRVAFAGLIHDLGKFLQRTKSIVSDGNKQLYCPSSDFGWTHIHAAFTVQAIDEIGPWLPSIRGDNLYPFKDNQNKNIDDSLINAAATHHKPKTFLQSVVAIADRLASAFEREEYETYIKQKDMDDYITARLITPFEALDKEYVKQNDLKYVYPLEKLSAKACFAKQRIVLSQDNASKEYKDLWEEFKNDLQQIPTQSLFLWSQ